MFLRTHSRAAVLAIAIGAVTLPAVALAGKTVVSGQQSLQLKVSLSPNKAAVHGTLAFSSTYKKPNSNQQPPYNTDQIILKDPKGMVLNPKGVTGCKESKVMAANGNAASACPSKSQIGTGSALLNARPTSSSLIAGQVTVYNGINDSGAGGHPKGSRNQILYIQTSLGTDVTHYFYLGKASNGAPELVATFRKPSGPGVGLYTIQNLNIKETSSASKPYSTNPPKCNGSWQFSLTTTNYFKQPSITAYDQVKCSK